MRIPIRETEGTQLRPVGTNYSNVQPVQNRIGVAVAEGVGRIGQSIENASQLAAELHRKEKEKADRARASDALSKIGAWEQANLYDPENGLSKYRGKNALGVKDKLLSDYNGFIPKLEEGLANDEQREMVRDIIAKKREGLEKEVSRYELAQMTEAIDADHKAGVEMAIANGSNKIDEDARLLEKDTAEEMVWARGQQLGWGKDRLTLEIQNVRTRFHMGVLQRLTDDDTGSAEEARSYLEKWGGEMESGAREKIEKYVSSLNAKEKAITYATEIASKYKTAKERREAANELPGGIEVRERTIQELKQIDADERQDKAERVKQAYGRVRIQIEKSNGWVNEHAPDFTDELDDDGKADAINYARQLRLAKQRATADDRREQDEANRRARSVFDAIDDPQKQLMYSMKPEELDALRRSDDPDVAERARRFLEADDITRNELTARQNNIRTQLKRGAQADRPQFKGLVSSMVAKIKSKKQRDETAASLNAWYDSHEEPPPLDVVRKRIADAVEVHVIKGDWGFEKKVPAELLTPEERARIGLPPKPAPTKRDPIEPLVAPKSGSFDLTDIPQKDRQQIEAALKAKKQPVTDQAIRNLYDKQRGK